MNEAFLITAAEQTLDLSQLDHFLCPFVLQRCMFISIKCLCIPSSLSRLVALAPSDPRDPKREQTDGGLADVCCGVSSQLDPLLGEQNRKHLKQISQTHQMSSSSSPNSRNSFGRVPTPSPEAGPSTDRLDLMVFFLLLMLQN